MPENTMRGLIRGLSEQTDSPKPITAQEMRAGMRRVFAQPSILPAPEEAIEIEAVLNNVEKVLANE